MEQSLNALWNELVIECIELKQNCIYLFFKRFALKNSILVNMFFVAL